MPHPPVVKRLIKDFLGRRPMRTSSLIITIFGDVVSQHGGTIWLGSLVRALDLMNISERLVRTSVFRLVQDGWLEADRVGRRSFYRLTPFGTHEYERAARRIYALEEEPWNGRWQLLIPLDIPDDLRENFRRSLQWQGFRSIAAGTFARPGGNNRTLLESLEEFGVSDQVMVMDAESAPVSSGQTTRKLVHECWRLDEVADHYREFLKRFAPLVKWLNGNEPAPATAFIARTLLIHNYRRVLLEDTALPEALLPPAWPGLEALAVTCEAYQALAAPSMRYITTEMESGNGPMPSCTADFYRRLKM